MSFLKSRFRSLMKQHEKIVVEDALQQNGNHFLATALWLGIHPESLRKKMVEHRLGE